MTPTTKRARKPVASPQPTAKDAPPPATIKQKRQAAIIAALRASMVSKGYAETSITDIAKGAEISASHFLYYYPSKEAVLVDLASQFHDKILADVGLHGDQPADERIHLLVDNVFLPGAMPREELGLLREIIALSAHIEPLHANLSEFALAIVAQMEDLFSHTPRQPGMSARDAAELASATWMGLLTNTAFQNRLDHAQARRLFRRALLSLANLEAAAASPVAVAPSPSSPRRRKPISTLP